MRRNKSICRRVLLALMAAFAMSAVAASAASAAAPEFKPATKQAFSGVIGAVHIDTAAGLEITCAKGASNGEVTNASTVGGVVWTLTECQSKEGTKPLCSWKSEGARQGEIVTKALVGELGEVAVPEAATGVGLLLKPASGKVWSEIEGSCAEPEVTPLEGTLATEIVTTKKVTKNIDLAFIGVAGAQKIKTIAVKGVDVKPSLKFFGAETLSWDATETLEFAKALEVT